LSRSQSDPIKLINFYYNREKDTYLSFPSDDAYLVSDFAFRRWELEEAINNLRENYHPTLLDRSDDLVYAKVEFDMRGSKKVS
jgi:hypothetical protein